MVKTYVEITYTVGGSVPHVAIVALETTREYIEEYKVDAHKSLSERFGVDSKLIKIVNWRYLGSNVQIFM